MINKLLGFVKKRAAKKLIGHIDEISSSSCSGWVINKNNPNQKLVLSLYFNDSWVCDFENNFFRQDLQNLKISNGNQGFDFDFDFPQDEEPFGKLEIREKLSQLQVSLIGSSKKTYDFESVKKELENEIDIIIESEIFHLDYYNTQLPKAFLSKKKAIEHYLLSGYKEGKNPHFFFDTNLYQVNSPDVVKANQNPLLHYLSSGWMEGRNPCSQFYQEHYVRQYYNQPTQSPLSHFIKKFISPKASLNNKNKELIFDEKYYLKNNPDVANEKINAQLHFFLHGYKEGRNPNKFFNTTFYTEVNKDVNSKEINPYIHYLFFGISEGRKSKKYFSVKKLNNHLHKEELDKPLAIPKVDIILPVYNGFEFLEILLPNIFQTEVAKFNLIAINDCSPDEKVGEILETFKKKYSNLTLINNPKNLGFVKSVNRGIEASSNHVIILNSDTELPKNWIERIISPILRNSKIASVTPLTNAGTIASFPNTLQNNSIFLNLPINEVDNVFKTLNTKNEVDCPTGVGFCMAMNKSAIDKIGGFDEILFEKGYGEENDWCRRASKAGFKNIITPNLFVWHKHGGSFTSEEKKRLIEANTKNLVKKHPEYFKKVRNHISADELNEVRFFAICKLIKTKSEKTPILYIDHKIGGGANSYLKNKINKVKKHTPCLLLTFNHKLEAYQFSIQFQNENYTQYFETVKDFFDFIPHLEVKEVFYNNLVTFKETTLILSYLTSFIEKENVNLIVTIHDYYPVCQSFTLINQKGNYCGAETDVKVCQNCIKSNSNYEQKEIGIVAWRKKWADLLVLSNEVICFSKSSEKIISKVYPYASSKIKVVPHTLPEKIENQPSISIKKDLHVGVIGTINDHKGADVVTHLHQTFENNNYGKVTVFGSLVNRNPKGSRLSQTGAYKVSKLPKIIENSGANAFLFPSVWPETYSFVIDEIMEMGLPLVCYDIGAPAERVSKYKLGKVIPLNSPMQVVIDSLESIREEGRSIQLETIKEKLINSKLFNETFYRKEYEDLRDENIDVLEHFIEYGGIESRRPSKEFDSKFYLDTYLDVKESGINPLIHYIDFGKKEGRLLKATSTINIYQSNISIDKTLRIGLLIHGYYENLIEELLDKSKNIPVRHQILISVISDKGYSIAKDWGKQNSKNELIVKKVENKGRDIAPAFISFREEILKLDLIGKIHTKKSLHTGAEQVVWRNQLVNNVVGSTQIVENSINIFQQNPEIGLVYPFSKLLPYWAYSWLSNKHVAYPLSQKLNLPLKVDGYIDYPMGSMFWFKPKALSQLLNNSISINDFADEPCGNDGTFAHAIERAFVDISKFNGFDFVELNFELKSAIIGNGKKNFFQYASKSKVDLLEKVSEKEVISFDIFDTLITRTLQNPDELFQILEAQIDTSNNLKSNFLSKRKEAEASARKRLKKDVSYFDIYQELEKQSNLPKQIVDFARQKEFELELQFTKPREIMVEVYNEAIKAKKEIWLITDMYLEKSQIEKLLEKNNILGYHKLLVSNELNLRKDNGKMWEFVLKEIKNPKSFIHLGDNEHSDIQQTTDRGLNNYHVLSGKNMFLNSDIGLEYISKYPNYSNQSFIGPIISELYNSPLNTIFNERLSPKKLHSAAASGYIGFGPLVLFFLLELAKAQKYKKREKLFFMAREGYFLKQFYDIFKNHPEVQKTFPNLPESEYLLVSRRAVLGAVEKTDEVLKEIISNNTYKGTLRDFCFYRMGYKLEEKNPKGKQLINLPEDKEKVFADLQPLLGDLEKHSKQERDALEKYLQKAGFSKESEIGLVDVGYSGTIQKFLQKITNKPTTGCYFVTKESTKQWTSNTNQTIGFFENNAGASSENPVLKFNLYLEFWLTSNQGQLQYFDDNENSSPVFKEKEPTKRLFHINEELSKGCITFISDSLNIGIENLNLTKENSTFFFEQIIRKDLWDKKTRKIAFLEDEFCGNEKNLDIIGDYKKFVL